MVTNIEKSFGNVVLTELAKQSKSQRALSDHLGITQATVSRKLAGKISMTLADAEQIASFLDLKLSRMIRNAK